MDEHEDTRETGPAPADEHEGAGAGAGAEAGAEAGAGAGPGAGDDAWTGASSRGREWLRQLETMIDDLATQAAPTVRQVGIKAAELAAAAGERAGPLAARAAEVTGDAGQRFAERSRALAEELRRDAEAAGETSPSTGSGTAAGPAGETPESLDTDGSERPTA
jgi:hypothetical protein